MKTKTSGNTPDTTATESSIDQDLVRRFVGGDEAAFVTIIQRYQSKIFAIAQSLLHNHSDAEEVTQDTFVRAHRSLARFRGDSSLATWLHRIALNLARNRYWYFFRRRRTTTLSLDFPIGEDSDASMADLIPSEAADPAQETSRQEFTELIADCMEKLDAPHREVLTLRNLQSLSYDEIAQRLGINAGTVKSRIARARERLRAQLSEACPEFSPDSSPIEWLEPNRQNSRFTPAYV